MFGRVSARPKKTFPASKEGGIARCGMEALGGRIARGFGLPGDLMCVWVLDNAIRCVSIRKLL
jgi:hypothetical protein